MNSLCRLPVCVLDATHPYADEVTKNIKEACQTAGFPYMRILRENTDMTENLTGSEKAHIRVADSMQEAVDLLNDKPYLKKKYSADNRKQAFTRLHKDTGLSEPCLFKTASQS